MKQAKVTYTVYPYETYDSYILSATTIASQDKYCESGEKDS